MSIKIDTKKTIHVEVAAVAANAQTEKLIARTQAVVEKITKESNPVAHESPPRPSRRVIAELLPAIPGLPIQNPANTFIVPDLTPPDLTEHPSPSKKTAAKLQMMGLKGVEDPQVRKDRLMGLTFEAFQGKSRRSLLPPILKSSTGTASSSMQTAKSQDQKQGFSVRGSAILPQPQKKSYIEAFINSCKTIFFEFAKANSSNKALTFVQFNQSFEAFRDILLSLESKAFLDSYIVRDSAVGVNKDPKIQKKFEEFKAKLDFLQTSLNNIGIKSLEEGKSVNFWSGTAGQRRASDDEESFSDSDIPFFKYLFDCWGYLKTHEIAQKSSERSNFTALLPSLFSSIFATYAKGQVNVYMASKNEPEAEESVINVDSAFWSAELYSLKNNSRVTHVNLYLHEGVDASGKDQWSAPLDLKSQDPEVIARRDALINLSTRDSKIAVPLERVKGVAVTWKKASQTSLELPDNTSSN